MMSSEDQNNKSKISLLENCSSTIVDGGLLITCPTDDIFLRLVEVNSGIPSLLACENTITYMTIATEERRIAFPVNPKHKLHLPMNTIQSEQLNNDDGLINRIPNEQESDIISEILGFDGAASIVRFSDDAGLFSNSRIKLVSGAAPNDWIGKRMADYWLPEQLARYKQSLMKDIQLPSFSYVAYLFTGQKAVFNVSARLALYRGDLVRIVKNHSCELIS